MVGSRLSTSLTNIDGNGTIVDGSLSSFSYAEDVTSLEPSTINGGLQQVNATIIGDGSGTEKDSRLLINNDVLLSDTELGQMPFRVKKVSKNQDLITISGDTVASRLNVEKTAGPHGGAGANLHTALTYYCGLCNITPIIDSGFALELEAVDVNFIGWKGNVWEHLKMLCAAVSVSATDNVGIEMFIDGEDVKFRKALQSTTDLSEMNSDISFEIDAFDAAKSIEIYNYNTSYGSDKVIYEQSNFEDTTEEKDKFQNSVNDSLQVNAGETVRKRFKINASLESVNQPQPVSAINRMPPAPYEGLTGEYVIVGVDDIPVLPSQWTDLGGSLKVSLVDEDGEPLEPGEIEIVVTAPHVPNLPHADDPGSAGYSPYKVGVESSGESEYPALWITGNGVFFEKKLEKYSTGSPVEYTSNDVGATIDNPFITNGFASSSRGIAAAQVACGPRVSVNQSIASGASFGSTVGSLQEIDNNIYRINTVSFGPGATSLTSVPASRLSSFNANWVGGTFATFNSGVGATLKFNEFTIIPLVKDA